MAPAAPSERPPLFSVQVECENFEYMLWFESLLFYGFDEQAALQKGDGDNGLLPSIVEKVILSKLTVLVEQVWDPLSRSQTALLVEFLHRLRRGYPTVLHGDNKYTQVGAALTQQASARSPF